MPLPRKATDVKTTLWLPRSMHHALKLRAAREGTSARAVVLAALAAYLGQPGKEDRR
jgi:hypothetical protein